MADETRDYARDLEQALRHEPQRSRPQVASTSSLGKPMPNGAERDRATFSTVLAANQELQKRLQTTLLKMQEAQDLIVGPMNEAQGPTNDPEKERQGLSIFERLGLETMRQANDLARLDRMLDRVLGALR